MKIRRRVGLKAAKKVTRAAPLVARAQKPMEPERSILRPFYEPFELWEAGFEFVPFELQETKEGFTVSAAMPGFKESEIEVRAEPWRLFLHAKHEETTEKKGESVFEEFNEFTRWVDFPAEVNPEKVKAVLGKGVLEVTLEKAQPAKKVEVHSEAA